MVESSLAYLELRLSGGADNTNPSISTGGIKSNTSFYSKNVTGISNITGITLIDAPGSANGSGTLIYNSTNKTLTWAPSGESAGDIVTLTEDGRYTITSPTDGLLFVSVIFNDLPLTDQQDNIIVSQKSNSLFDDITKLESLNGNIEYRCFYIHNEHVNQPFVNVFIYISQQPLGEDILSIGLDPVGIGDGLTTGVATTNPNTITFSTPSIIDDALDIGQIDAGKSYAVWVKREIPANTLISNNNDLSALRIRAGY